MTIATILTDPESSTVNVKRLPVDAGRSGWYEVLPEPSRPKILKNRIRADWLIVGAGFAGLTAAHRLHQLQTGDNIVLLDAGRIGEGPAGRNSGFMIDLPHDLASDDYSGTAQSDKDEIHLNRSAIDFARSMAAEYQLADEIFNQCGKINVAASNKGARHLENYEKHLSALKEPCAALNFSQLSELTGSHYYKCGLFTPGTVMLQPAAYVRGIAEKLSNKINLYENSPALSISKNGPVYTITTPAGSIETEKMILAVNGHVESFGFFKRRLMHVILYASMTRELSLSEQRLLKGEASWNLIPADPLGTTVRRINGRAFGGNRIVIRNCVTYNPSMQVSTRQFDAIAMKHRRSFIDRFPALESVNMEYQWSGRLCLSKNSVPAFGEVEEGIFSAACQNGLGATRGTLSGLLAAELAAARDSSLLQHYLSLEKPARLPPEPFMSIGARSILKLKQWRAGKEL